MNGEEPLQNYENMPRECLTLTEISEKVKGNYPIAVRVVPKQNEIPTSQELPGDTELLLEKPRWLQFVLIRILDILDEEKTTKEKGAEFIQMRKAYVGKKFLIPVCYPGTFKLVSKQDQHSRYVSIEQIIQDLPRFIKINQETEYNPLDEPHTSTKLPAGTKLEVKNVQVSGKVRYIKCKSSKRTYTFREDFPVNCTAVDDPEEHTLLNLAGEFVLLPKDVQFQTVWADDVVLKDDDDASTLLTLLGGPVKILRSFIRRNVFIAWMTREGTRRNTLALVPHRIWNNHMVEVKSFQNKEQKQKYINKHFGDQLDSNFVVNRLYLLKPVETDVIWLIAPTTKSKDENTIDYEVVEKKLVDYENVIRAEGKMVLVESEKAKDEDDKDEDYENPPPPELLDLQDSPVSKVPPKPTVPKEVPLKQTVPKVPPKPTVPKVPLKQTVPKVPPKPTVPNVPPKQTVPKVPPKPTVLEVPPRMSTCIGATILLPTAKSKKEDLLKIIKEKARLGFDKVHEQLLRRVRQSQTAAAETSSEKKSKQYECFKSESDRKQTSKIREERELSKSLSERDSSIDEEERRSNRLNLAYEQNKRRPLPPTPLQTLLAADSVNATDDDKFEIYHQDKDLETAKCSLGVFQDYKSKREHNMADSISQFPNLYKIGQTQQSKDDFYLYTVEELVECLKLCKLEKFAVLCSSHKLDGAFFKNFRLDQLLTEPFCLSKLELIKVKKMIEDGWRPKTEQAYVAYEH